MNKILYGEILMPGSEEEQAEQERKIQDGFWQTVKKAAGRIPFIEDVAACYYCMLDPATPTRVRGILLAALAYFVLPLDLVPDFIAGFGFTDDIAVLGAAIAAIRSSLKERHYIAAKKTLESND
ncbi:MAG: DUF1232 domain-containing protein [Hyphomicrobiales bacterium]|nr:DUF1232 domain-containing protein [Hyphomicrobiales bacterium]